MERPVFVTDEHLDYLNKLRKSGVTNMFGAAPYIQRKFKVGIDEAQEILSYWMKTFSDS